MADKVDALAGAEETVAATTGSAVACWWLCGKLGVCRDQRKVADAKLVKLSTRRGSFARRHPRLAKVVGGGWTRAWRVGGLAAGRISTARNHNEVIKLVALAQNQTQA